MVSLLSKTLVATCVILMIQLSSCSLCNHLACKVEHADGAVGGKSSSQQVMVPDSRATASPEVSQTRDL